MEVLELALGAMPSRIYDTQLAASFCGYGEQVSYSSLVETICNVKLEKDQTRTDWTRRPLSQDQLRYAMDDVRYLPEIRDSLDQKLLELGRKEWFDNESDLLGATVSVQVDPRDAWKRLKGGGRLPAKEQHLARDLAEWRERRAQKRDRPREWILSSRAILDICNARPRDLGDLARIDSLNDGIVRHSGREILGILKDGVNSDDQSPVWTKGRMLDRTERDRVRQIMNRIREMAEDAAISPSLLANRNDVEQYVSGDSAIPLLSGWRYDFVGRQLVAEFAQV